MGFIGDMWTALKKPSIKYSLGFLLVGGFVAGFLSFGSFHFIMTASNNPALCMEGCHEMKSVTEEWKKSVHGHNRVGVAATCPDCHVPHDKDIAGWFEKVYFKVTIGVKDIWHHTIGTYNTPEKFEAARYELAQLVTERFKSRGSKECMFCHKLETMAMDKQDKKAASKHKSVLEGSTKKSCIECNAGVAHEEPKEPEKK